MPDRHPIVSGVFYPGTSRSLRHAVDALLRTPPLPVPEPVLQAMADATRQEAHPAVCDGPDVSSDATSGLTPGVAQGAAPKPPAPASVTTDALLVMLPHAGYVYSGRVAGRTLSQVRLAPVVFMLGPNHTGRGAPLAVWPEGDWLTPLGSVPVHERAAAALLDKDGGYTANRTAHEGEHSLEVLLPLLQVRHPALSIIPVAVSEQDAGALQRAGASLARTMQELAAAGVPSSIVLSSDMSHYVTRTQAEERDALALGRMAALDPEGLYATVRHNRITMCGVLPAVVALHACRALGAESACLAAYDTSASASGDHERVVGYAGMVAKRPTA